MPVTPHLVSGKVYDIYSVALAGATVTLTHSSITPSISATTNGAGEYVINLFKLSSQWTKGDSFTITASKTAEGTITSTNTISGVGGQTINLTLTETSNLNYASNVFNKHNLNFVLLTDYAGNKITNANPIPIISNGDRSINDPAVSWVITRGDQQPDSETIVVNGISYKRNFTYTNNVLTARSAWVRQ